MGRLRRTAATALVLALVGCGDDNGTEPPPAVPNLAGTWTGTLPGLTLTLDIFPPAEGGFIGVGTMSNGQEDAGLSASGSYDHPSISMVLDTDADFGEPLDLVFLFFGQATRDGEMQGTITQGDLSGETLSLTRQ